MMQCTNSSFCHPDATTRRLRRAVGLSVLTLLSSVLLVIRPLAAYSTEEEQLVTIEVVKKQAWTGERVPILVELRTRGTFAGAVSFDLPELPGCLLIKVGNPVIGSKEIQEVNYFTQTHEFALFSQRVGIIEIPPFTARYSAREGFTGPVIDIQTYVPSAQLEIKRPPGSEKLSFVIATSELQVTEVWSPNPGSARVGDVIKRTISQQAMGVPGMALAPVSDHVVPGVRTYSKQPEIRDLTERGTFVGHRQDEVTYLVQKPGTHLLPELIYYWWNPETNELKTTALPSTELEVAGVVESTVSGSSASAREYLRFFGILAVLIALIIILRKRLIIWFQRIKQAIDSTYRGLPPLNP